MATTVIQTAVMVHHNPIYTLYSDGRIFNTKSGKWIKSHTHLGNNGTYQMLKFNYYNKSGKQKKDSLARALLCYFVSEKEYFDPLFSADHFDQNPLNNSLSNLRWASKLQQVLNRGKFVNNKSGFAGVCFKKSSSKWRAAININKKTKHLGYFDNKFDAVIAYRKAHALEHGLNSEYYNTYKIKQSELNIKKLI